MAFCKSKGLKQSGTKDEVLKRVLEHLDKNKKSEKVEKNEVKKVEKSSQPSIVKALSEKSSSIQIQKNKFGNYEHFDSGEKYDYVILSSIFGFFPEQESYNLIPRFWDMCNVGMGITTLNKDLYRGGVLNSLTTHDPGELESALWNLPGVKDVEMLIDIPRHRKTISRGMAAHVWRQ
jgi:hypothetical protein